MPQPRVDFRSASAYLPLIVLLVAYLATTVVGATIFMLPAGQRELALFLGSLQPSIASSIGGGVYLTLLFLPLALIPVCAVAGQRIGCRLAPIVRTRVDMNTRDLSGLALWAMTAAAVAYCLLKLASVNGLVPHVLLNADADYQDRMIERARLMASLRFVFYAVVYAVIPTLAAVFFARFLLGRRRWLDLAGFVANYAFYYYLITAVYLKAPFLVFFLMLAAVVILARASLWYLPVLLALAGACFLSVQLLIGGLTHPSAPTPPAPSEVTPPAIETTAPQPPKTNFPAAKIDVALPTPATPSLFDHYCSALRATARSIVFRLSSAFPYYVALFQDPANRCGIETNRIPFLPRPKADLPTKVFAAMYPSVTWTTGFAPAAAHVSAYGEAGLPYAILVMCVSGFSVGFLGAIATRGEGPLFVVLNAAVCVFAYYLTQVPFLGALTYGHGLVFFVAPLIVLLGTEFLANRTSLLRKERRSLAPCSLALIREHR